MTSELDNIQLSALVIGEWYKDALLASPDAPPAIRQPAPGPGTKPIPEAAEPAPFPPVAAEPKPAGPTADPPESRPAAAEPHPASAERRPAAAEPAEASNYKYLGKNGKKITILVNSRGIPFLPDNQLTFLTKILEACRMNIGDVAIVNTATAPVIITALKQQLTPAVVLLFGVEPAAIKLPINFPVFKVQPYDDCSYLSAPALTQLVQQSEESKLLKSKLWVCLKTLFNV